MKDRVLITGISGFVGSHLAEYLLGLNRRVFGSIRRRSRQENVEHLKDAVTFVECDLRDLSSVQRLVEGTEPDIIFHLAAQTFVPTSLHAPAETLQSNIICQLNVFEAIRRMKTDPTIHVALSSEEYGRVLPEELPVRETNPLRPLSPYAVSKVAQDFLAYQYHVTYGLRVIRTRAFNHAGPRQSEEFALSNFARQIALIEAGKHPAYLSVGNLDAQRDYTDVRDVVRAYWLAVSKCEPGVVYNVSQGRGFRLGDLLEMLLKMTSATIEVRQDPERLRPVDALLVCGDSTAFRERTGWKPEIPIERTLGDSLQYWRQRLGVR